MPPIENPTNDDEANLTPFTYAAYRLFRLPVLLANV